MIEQHGWQAVIFDCDGVLVDSEVIANRVFQRHLAGIGVTLSLQETMDIFVGRSMLACKEIIENRFGATVPEDFLARLDADIFRALGEEVETVPGIETALDSISCHKAVASSGSHEKMRVTLGRTGLLRRFTGHIYSASDVARGKPCPDLFLHAAAQLAASPAYCVVVEDSALGVEGAVAAGMQAFGFAARASAQRLAAAGAIVFDDMRELPQLLRRHAPVFATA